MEAKLDTQNVYGHSGSATGRRYSHCHWDRTPPESQSPPYSPRPAITASFTFTSQRRLLLPFGRTTTTKMVGKKVKEGLSFWEWGGVNQLLGVLAPGQAFYPRYPGTPTTFSSCWLLSMICFRSHKMQANWIIFRNYVSQKRDHPKIAIRRGADPGGAERNGTASANYSTGHRCVLVGLKQFLLTRGTWLGAQDISKVFFFFIFAFFQWLY